MSDFLSSLQVTVLGEGEDRPEHTIPIDVPYGKLVEWVVDRKLCKPNWKKVAEPIRLRVAEAVEAVERGKHPEVDAFLKDTPCYSYFDCKELVCLLEKHVEGMDQKDFFGYHSDPRMKEWNKLLGLLEKNNLYLADTSSVIIRTIQYDIPSLKNSVHQISNQNDDLLKKEHECESNAGQMMEKFRQECAKWNIKGENIDTELGDRVRVELPQLFDSITRNAQKDIESLEQAVRYYIAFTNYVLGDTGEKMIDDCPTLSFWIKYGNASVGQYKEYLATGEFTEVGEVVTAKEDGAKEDDVIDISSFITVEDDAHSGTLEVDGGEQEEKENASSEEMGGFSVDMVDAVVEDTGGDVTINWDISETDLGTNDNGGAPEINWDVGDLGIEVVDSSASGLHDDQYSAESTANEDEETLLEHAEYRNRILDDFLALEIFLQQRLREMQAKGNTFSVLQYQSASPLIQNQSISSVTTMLEAVQRHLSHLSEDHVVQLIEMKSSRRYLDRLSVSIRSKADAASKLRLSVQELQQKRERNATRIAEIAPKLQRLIGHVKRLQQALQKELKAKSRNRTIRIIGEINAL